MERNTIDFGIDLGTTNSEIAVIDGTRTEIIKNNLNMEYTPSAVFIDKAGRIFVGQKAKDRIFLDEEDSYTEFKRDMGTDRKRTFKTSGVVMKPEELSAEVLKSLKADVARRMNNEAITTAVITVPADFELPQNEATKRAAQLAGLENCQLLQEPIAAALAYGFQSQSDKVFWMVYDFGGGTFDAAIIKLQDGLFRVVHHGGDNFLGGKDLDWRIVEEIVVPAVLKQHKLEKFVRGEKKWKSAFAKMKLAVENAKIQLSNEDTALLMIDNLVKEEGIDFEMDIERKDVARLAEPLILKSIRICKEVIKEARLKPGDIEKLILVGGPTLSPYLRDQLTDPVDGLGIPLEFSVDPLTVVARGAAIYAGSQLVERLETAAVPAGVFQLALQYQPIGSDSEPNIGGRFSNPEVEDFSGYTLEILSSSYDSGRIPLGKNGSFITSVVAEPGRQNQYQLGLYDPMGQKLSISPDSFTYTIGNAPSDPPLTHSVGVALSNNDVIRFLKKGTPLPGCKMIRLRSTYEVKKNEEADLIAIPVIEGEEEVADLNSLIGKLVIHSSEIKRGIPAGSEVEVKLKIDKSRLVMVSAYIPMIDLEASIQLDLKNISPDLKELKKDIDIQKKKFKELQEQAVEAGETAITERLGQLESERSIQSIEASIRGGEAAEAQKHLLKLKKELASIEAELEWPSLVKEAEAEMDRNNDLMEDSKDPAMAQKSADLEKEMRDAIQSKDAYRLKRLIEEHNNLRFGAMAEKPEFWLGFFYYLSKDEKANYVNSARAEELMNDGLRAIQNGNLDRLKMVVASLMHLLPREKQEEINRGYGSTVTK